MSESELRALITSELQGLNLEMEPVDHVVERIMDAVRNYAFEEAADAADWARREVEER